MNRRDLFRILLTAPLAGLLRLPVVADPGIVTNNKGSSWHNGAWVKATTPGALPAGINRGQWYWHEYPEDTK